MDQRVKLIAAARFIHDGRQLFPRDRFAASERDAADLLALRFATKDPDQSQEVSPPLQLEAPPAEEPPVRKRKKSKKVKSKRRRGEKR